MKALFHLASELQQLFDHHGWTYCFIGGLALQRWGEPRLTTDVDVSLLTGFGGEDTFIDTLLAHYEGRIDDAGDFARRNRVLLLHSSGGIGIDIALAALPFEAEAAARASTFEFLPSVGLLTCSAEDLIVMKAFADRSRDWLDIEGILIRQKGVLDWPYITQRLTPLCELKEAPDILQRLEALRRDEASET